MASRTVKIGPHSMAGIQAGDVFFDTELKRFGARAGARGATYFVFPRVDGRQRWITIGRHGPLTPDQARKRAKQILAEADAGGDPTRERDEGKSKPMFADFAEAWLVTHVRTKRKPTTAREYARIVAHDLAPAFAKIRIDRITRSDVVKLHGDLGAARYSANRALAVLSAIMSHAEQLGHRSPGSNPARGVERYRERKRKRPLSIAEIKVLWQHLDAMGDTMNPYVIASIRLLLLTGMRREEVLGLKWEYVDLIEGLVHLPDAKTGARDVVLSQLAVDVLTCLPRIESNCYVLPGHRHGRRLVNISDSWQIIRSELGFPEVRLHDLRHSVATFLARSEPLVVVRDAMGHSEISTTSDYSHCARDDIRIAVNNFASAVVRSA